MDKTRLSATSGPGKELPPYSQSLLWVLCVEGNEDTLWGLFGEGINPHLWESSTFID